MQDSKERIYLTVAEAARELDVSPSTVWRWIDSGRLPAFRAGPKTIRIKREELQALMRPAREGRQEDAAGAVQIVEPSAELKAVVLRFYEAMASGDATAIARMTSREPGVLAIGTDPHEWWSGYDAVVQVFEVQMVDWQGGIPIVAGEIEAFSEGAVGCVADRPTLHLPDGTNVPLRLTAVLHIEKGEWKFVQSHASIGVLNEESVGRELSR
jgi:excisionase family DNA binding protein